MGGRRQGGAIQQTKKRAQHHETKQKQQGVSGLSTLGFFVSERVDCFVLRCSILHFARAQRRSIRGLHGVVVTFPLSEYFGRPRLCLIRRYDTIRKLKAIKKNENTIKATGDRLHKSRFRPHGPCSAQDETLVGRPSVSPDLDQRRTQASASKHKGHSPKGYMDTDT